MYKKVLLFILFKKNLQHYIMICINICHDFYGVCLYLLFCLSFVYSVMLFSVLFCLFDFVLHVHIVSGCCLDKLKLKLKREILVQYYFNAKFKYFNDDQNVAKF